MKSFVTTGVALIGIIAILLLLSPEAPQIPQDPTTIESVVYSINNERYRLGLSQLKVNAVLSQAAKNVVVEGALKSPEDVLPYLQQTVTGEAVDALHTSLISAGYQAMELDVLWLRQTAGDWSRTIDSAVRRNERAIHTVSFSDMGIANATIDGAETVFIIFAVK